MRARGPGSCPSNGSRSGGCARPCDVTRSAVPTRHARRPLAALALLGALAVAGCRSDGGIGPSFAAHGLEATTDMLAAQFARDVQATGEHLDDVAAWPCELADDPFADLRRTVRLYLEGDTDPARR